MKQQDDAVEAQGGRAFPVPGDAHFGEEGMTLRDWFAGQALVGVLVREHEEHVAEAAYAIADAMVKERLR